MKTKTAKTSTLLFLSILISLNAYAQWTYPDAEPIENDVMIIYEIKYDRVLSEKEKQSLTFKKEIIMVFNNDKLFEKYFSNKDMERFNLIDYEKEMLYQCSKFDTYGECISSKLKNPSKEIILQEKEVTILGLPCQVSTTIMKGETREIYTTKAFPIKYVREFGARIIQPTTKPEDKLLLYKEMSPINYLTKNSPPLLMIQGDQDTTIPVKHAYYMEAKAKEIGAPLTTLIIKNAGHNWRKVEADIEPTREEIIQKTVDYLVDHLK